MICMGAIAQKIAFIVSCLLAYYLLVIWYFLQLKNYFYYTSVIFGHVGLHNAGVPGVPPFWRLEIAFYVFDFYARAIVSNVRLGLSVIRLTSSEIQRCA